MRLSKRTDTQRFFVYIHDTTEEMLTIHRNHLVSFKINKTEALCLNNHLHNVLLKHILKLIRIM